MKLREQVHSINKFIEKQRISLVINGRDVSGSTFDMMIDPAIQEHLEEDGRIPDLARTQLRRIFNNSDWRQGGRFYGGWWQTVPSKWRSCIQINGSPTVELDYSGFSIRAIYHTKGRRFEGDPYEVPAIKEIVERRGDQWSTVRDAVKRATHALINAGRDKKLNCVRSIKLPRYLTKAVIFRLIEERHAAISDKFRSGEGLFLMNKEARICQAVLRAGIEEGIPLLPIHDAFIVSVRHREWLRAKMIDAYRVVFEGFEPEVSEKGSAPGAHLNAQLSATGRSAPSLSIFPVATSDKTLPYVETVSSDLLPTRTEKEAETPQPGKYLAFEWKDSLAAEQEAASALEKRLEGDRKFKAFITSLSGTRPQRGS
jgi:hypothetical protein